MAPDGNSQAVVLVKRDRFNPSRFAVAEDDGTANKFGLGFSERTEDR